MQRLLQLTDVTSPKLYGNFYHKLTNADEHKLVKPHISDNRYYCSVCGLEVFVWENNYYSYEPEISCSEKQIKSILE